jgi:NitT/TauT family transport system permease protein
MSNKALKVLLPALTGALLIGVWYAVHFWVISEDRRFLLPTPAAILSALHDQAPYLARAALNTSKAAVFGFVLAVVISFSVALLLSLSPLIRASLYPYLMAVQLTPLPVLAPICVIWVGPGFKSVALLTFVIAFFPLVVNTTQGLISVDRNLVELFASYRANRFQQLFRLRVPAALPYFFTGLRIAATLAPIGAVIADMNAGSSAGDGGGLGFAVVIFSSQARYPAMFAAALVTCMLGFLFNLTILTLEWFALHHWHDSYERSDR